MDWNKVIKKGLEGAILTGGAGALSQDAMIIVATAILGFVYRAGKNWFKNKDKINL